MSHQHFTAANFEHHYLLYKAEGFLRGESIEGYSFRHHVRFNLFDKWYHDKKVTYVHQSSVYTESMGFNGLKWFEIKRSI